LWAALLHDIAKRSRPFIEGKDHVHPFISANVVLSLLERLGVIKSEQADLLLQTKRLVKESMMPLPKEWFKGVDPSVPLCTQKHSHHNLPAIFRNLWDLKLLPRGSFGDHLFRMVMFHSSFDHVTCPPMVALTASEIGRFADPPFLKRLIILQCGDDLSYCFFRPEKETQALRA